jgi:glycosyltransferase involved in cell wall biosynthesis
MIVKNEEENLPRLYHSISTLINDKDIELIVVDTGSTDKTKEIVRKYTDKLYDFKWINDFS